jgi:putative ABC transport system substrate-binding protein
VVAGGLIEQGMVASLERPGGNVTSLSLFDIEGKQLELLKEAAPHIARVAIIVNPANPNPDRFLAILAAEASVLGVQLHRMEARAPGELDGTFADLDEGRADALLVPSDTMFGTHRHRIVELAATHCC